MCLLFLVLLGSNGILYYLCITTEIAKTLNMRFPLYFQSIDFLKFLIKIDFTNYKKSLLKPPTFAF